MQVLAAAAEPYFQTSFAEMPLTVAVHASAGVPEFVESLVPVWFENVVAWLPPFEA